LANVKQNGMKKMKTKKVQGALDIHIERLRH